MSRLDTMARFELPDAPDTWECPMCHDWIELPCTVYDDDGIYICENCFDEMVEDMRREHKTELTASMLQDVYRSQYED